MTRIKNPTEEQIDAALAFVDACNHHPFDRDAYRACAADLHWVTDMTSLPADIVALTILAAEVRWLRDGRDKTREAMK